MAARDGNSVDHEPATPVVALRQPVVGRFAGYDDDATQAGLRTGEAGRTVGGKNIQRDATSTCQMGRFETEYSWLTSDPAEYRVF